MIRIAFTTFIGSCCGIPIAVCLLRSPTPFNIFLACMCTMPPVLMLVIFYWCSAERYLARALKAVDAAKREALLKKAADEATRESQLAGGVARAQHLLTLAKVRREQGLLPEARDAVECVSDSMSRVHGCGDLKIELAYWKALITHEMGQDAGAITILEQVVAVPLHELTPASARVQLKSCDLLLDLLTKVGYEASIPKVTRRAQLLRAGH